MSSCILGAFDFHQCIGYLKGMVPVCVRSYGRHLIYILNCKNALSLRDMVYYVEHEENFYA